MRKDKETRENVVKKRVWEYDPQIYPQKLWIGLGATKEDLADFEEIAEMEDSTIADTTPIRKLKPKKLGGVLIRFRNRMDMSFENVTHESVHAAMCMLDYCGVKFHADNQEPISYLAGWVADCIDKVKRGKI
jgi:hypothetical protein